MTKKLSAQTVEDGYPKDSTPEIERQTNLMDSNIKRLEDILPRLRLKLKSILVHDGKEVQPLEYAEDKQDSVIIAILKERNTRLLNISTILEKIINEVQL